MKKNDCYNLLGQYEIMDRTYVTIENIENNLSNHKDLTVRQYQKIVKALNLLDEVYQDAAKKALKNVR